jgi:hypothetical protein
MNSTELSRRRRTWGNIAAIAALVGITFVVALVGFMLHRNSPLIATAPSTSEPETTGQ